MKILKFNFRHSRRGFLAKCFQWAGVLCGGFAVYGCQDKKKASVDPCQDLSALSSSELQSRQQMGYVEQSSFEDRTCLNCNLFVKSQESLPCGSCLVIKGPVAEKGYCSVWAPIVG